MCNLISRLVANIAVLILSATLLSSCSNKQIYEAIQHSNQQECQKNQKTAREKCMSQVSEPYEDYEQARQEALEGDS